MSTERDRALKRAHEKTRERAKRLGYDDRRANKMAKEATEKADATKKRLNHDGWK